MFRKRVRLDLSVGLRVVCISFKPLNKGAKYENITVYKTVTADSSGCVV